MMAMPHTRKLNPRAEFRLRERLRTENSATLAEKFPTLKSLTAVLHYFDPTGSAKTGEMRYTVNVAHAKSVFRFDCHNADCAGGDFDLSDVLAETVRKRRKVAEGEARCQGERTRLNSEKLPCRNLLRYKLSLRFF